MILFFLHRLCKKVHSRMDMPLHHHNHFHICCSQYPSILQHLQFRTIYSLHRFLHCNCCKNQSDCRLNPNKMNLHYLKYNKSMMFPAHTSRYQPTFRMDLFHLKVCLQYRKCHKVLFRQSTILNPHFL